MSVPVHGVRSLTPFRIVEATVGLASYSYVLGGRDRHHHRSNRLSHYLPLSYVSNKEDLVA